MRACNFCGCKFDEKTAACPNCGSTTFAHVCPNCSNIFEGAYCTECGVRYDEPARTCPNCGTVYYTDDCPTCGQDLIKAKAQAKAKVGITGQGTDTASQAGKGNLPLAAIVLSCLGVFTCNFPFAIVGVALAYRAEKNGTKNKLTQTAKILAVVGMILSLIFWVIIMNNGSSN